MTKSACSCTMRRHRTPWTRVHVGECRVTVGERWESSKRAIYLWSLGLSSPSLPVVVWLRWDEEPLLGVTYGLLCALLVTVFVGLLTRRMTPATAERAVISVIPVLWIVRMFAVLYLQPDLAVAAAVVNQSIGPGFVILAIVAYLALPARQGLALSGGFVLICLGLVLPRVSGEILRVGMTLEVIGLLRVGLTTAVSVALLFALASLKEHLAREKAQAEANAHLARTDQLTGLPNRRAVTERLRELLALAERHDRPLTLAVIDVDHFKAINDRAGHLAGDEVLRAVADTMVEVLRDSDVVGRWGGDELIVVLPETATAAAATTLERVLERVRSEVVVACPQRSGVAADGPGPVTLSVGLAQRAEGETQDRLLSRADRALYGAKASGRDRVSIDGWEPVGV